MACINVLVGKAATTISKVGKKVLIMFKKNKLKDCASAKAKFLFSSCFILNIFDMSLLG